MFSYLSDVYGSFIKKLTADAIIQQAYDEDSFVSQILERHSPQIWRDLCAFHFEIPAEVTWDAKDFFILCHANSETIAKFNQALQQDDLFSANSCIKIALDQNQNLLVESFITAIGHKFKTVGHILAVDVLKKLIDKDADQKHKYAFKACVNLHLAKLLFDDSTAILKETGWDQSLQVYYGGIDQFVATGETHLKKFLQEDEMKAAYETAQSLQPNIQELTL